MEKQFKLDYNGQQVQKSDLELIGEVSGLADDRVFAELLRLAPYTGAVARGILAYGNTAAMGTGTVQGNGATGAILVNPFRAIIGARTAAGTDARKAHRDVRSAIVIAEGATSLTQAVSISANASGNPRYDMVYAAVAVDANSSPTVSRKVKDAVTKVVASQTVSIAKVTSITIGVAAGTPAATPALPAAPADSGGTYYVPLAYIRVPNGFNASSTVVNKDIYDTATVFQLSTRVGGYPVRPATSNVKALAAGTSTNNGALGWNALTGRGGMQMPPSMVGAESLLLAIDLTNASNGNWSHQDGDVVDDSIDWRKRIIRWVATVAPDGVAFSTFPWNATTDHILKLQGSSAAGMPGYSTAGSPTVVHGMGGSFLNAVEYIATLAASGASASTPANGYNVPANLMAGGTAIGLFVDNVTGSLKLNVVGSPRAAVLFWIDASAPFVNM